MQRNSVISFKNKDKITINQIKSNFSIRFVHRSGTKYSFGEMDEIGDFPRTPRFFSQDGPESLSMEFGPYGAIPFFCIMQKKENVFFFPKRLIILHMIISP